MSIACDATFTGSCADRRHEVVQAAPQEPGEEQRAVADFKEPSEESLARLRAIIDEAFGRSKKD